MTALLVTVLVFIAGWSAITAYGLWSIGNGNEKERQSEDDGGSYHGHGNIAPPPHLRLIQGGKTEEGGKR